jgi:hypothetical protein
MNYTLEKTSGACPEQYDVYDESGEQIAYFRLRHGMFRVDCPACGYETVYYAGTESDGMFLTEKERQYHFRKAFKAIDEYTKKQRSVLK